MCVARVCIVCGVRHAICDDSFEPVPGFTLAAASQHEVAAWLGSEESVQAGSGSSTRSRQGRAIVARHW